MRVLLKLLSRFAWFGSLPFVASCSTLGYYFESIDGHLNLIASRQPVAELLKNDSLEPALREQLLLSQAARDFAIQELGLPDNDSYRNYADIGRPYAVWNVVATPQFSVQPEQWCFVFVGCINYRGYFSREKAEAFAAGLREQGYDVYVSGARAYSTLGWFSDPLLNTMLDGSEGRLVGVIFHELAHQQLFINGDSGFNEAFATAVELEGVRRWFEAKNDPAAYEAYVRDKVRTKEFFALLGETRRRLAAAYAEPLSEADKRSRKQAIFAQLRADYAQFSQRWGGDGGFDGYMRQDLNNANLALVATYQENVPAFQALLHAHGGDLQAFYTEARRIGALPREARRRTLLALAESLETQSAAIHLPANL